MDWSDLNLDAAHEATLRTLFKIDRPDQVVALAWGARELLGRVVPAAQVDAIRSAFPRPGRGGYDSTGFSLGAQLGEPAASVDRSAGFENRRAELIEQMATATGSDRAALESQLVNLYSAERSG